MIIDFRSRRAPRARWGDALHRFAGVWRECYGDEAWAANPWVWVFTWEPCERPEDLE